MELSQHKILITGATRGIGLALAKKFLSLNNRVIITGRNEADLDSIQKQYPTLATFMGDLAVPADLDRLILFIEREHPDLNILINNAGIQYNYLFAEEPHIFSKIDYEMTVNFLAPAKLTAALLPILMANHRSAIINVSSGMAIVPKKLAAVYSASKAAMHLFSQSLRYQLPNTRVFELIPPLVATDMTQGRGKGKISADQLADAFVICFKHDRFEANIGKIRLLRILHRLWPRLADRIINNNDG
ncbi:putative oxidoreductase [Dyadobacter jejuensis]|uniref:Putative oxidoreductase n=1 Tax=Dyadobacter jejuensis TaxID=1082580 RepID=A0A316AHQ9_9BACT|nr:SDR family NAD(P)-dependent oxidoreductase [Dyadobacter jejuensis]PWJ57171.1 putative oxidoreductase [Dyadobacter jejuensis]